MRAALAIAALLSVCRVNAQFGELSTTWDGSVMYFDTVFRRVGTQNPIQGRIWRISAAPGSTPELVLERQKIGPELFPPGFMIPPDAYNLSNPYSLSRPVISADGSKLAFTSGRACAGRRCYLRETSTANFLVLGAEPREIEKGFGLMSRNGRYLATVATYMSGNVIGIVDIESGAPVLTDNNMFHVTTGSGCIIADNGRTVLTTGNSLWLAEPGAPPRQLNQTDQDDRVHWSEQATIDAAGRTVAWTALAYLPAKKEARYELRVLDTVTGSNRLFVSVPEQESLSDPQLTSDGKMLVFASTAQFGTTDPPGPPQYYAVSIDGTGFRRITANPFGVRRAALSGDGRALWYFSNNNTLHHVDIAAAKDTRMLDRTPEFLANDAAVGSVGRIVGFGLADSPADTTEARISMNGAAVPILSRSPTRVEFQVPWQLPATAVRTRQAIRVELGTASSFFEPDPDTFVGIATLWPKLELAIHGDWSALVTQDFPARAGEVIHLYGIGFGPVDLPQTDGQPAPASPPARVTKQFACFLSGPDQQRFEAPVLFAGLAPGLVGYYQISLQLPRDTSGWSVLNCPFPNGPTPYFVF